MTRFLLHDQLIKTLWRKSLPVPVLECDQSFDRSFVILLLSVIINPNFMAACLSIIWPSTWRLGLWLLILTFSYSLFCTVMNYIDIAYGLWCACFASVFSGVPQELREQVEWEICLDWPKILSVTHVWFDFYWKFIIIFPHLGKIILLYCM